MRRCVWAFAFAAIGCEGLIGADFGHGNAQDQVDASGADEGGALADGATDVGNTSRDGSTAGKDAGSTKKDSGGGGGGGGDSGACRPLVVPCLDLSDPKVIEVPTNGTMQNAIMNVKAGGTIQINGASLGSGWRIPAFVTLHGCNGAKIVGSIGAAGSGAVFEGFDVPGSIVLNQTGVFVVRWNRFDGNTTDPGVSARSIDALVSASVTATVEQNEFADRPAGITVDTAYDTMTHSVDVTVQNNLFHGVAAPIVASRGGLVGKITSKFLHNTLTGFTTGMALYSLQDTPTVAGNVFANGTNAVNGDSPFNLSNDLLFMCGAGTATPLGGAFASGDPKLVDATNGDLHLGAGSDALDRVPPGSLLPSKDYAGCPRPVGHGGAVLGDIGAYEAP